MQVLHLGAVWARTHVFDLLCLRVTQWQREPITKLQQRTGVELLLLVTGHAPLTRGPHTVAFLGFSQDHRRLPTMIRGGVVRRVNLDRVVAAAPQAVDIFVRTSARSIARARDTC
jgi:hypothetical protein